MYRLNYHHLQYFYVIARLGSIAAACKELHLAQPTLSAQLKTLESGLGKKLFERVGKRLVLTSEGQDILRYAEGIIGLGRELEDFVRDRRDVQRKAIQIGVALGIPKAFSHELLKTLFQIDRSAYVHCREAPFEELLRDLREYRLDVVFSDRIAGSSVPGRFQHTSVGKVPIVFAARPRLARKLAGGGFPSWIDGAPLILPRSPDTVAEQVQSLLARSNLSPRIVADVADVESARRLALEGLGVVPMNRHTFEMSKPKGGLTIVGKRPTGMIESVYLIEAADRLGKNTLCDRLVRQFRLPSK